MKKIKNFLKDIKNIVIIVLTLAVIGTAWYGYNKNKLYRELGVSGMRIINTFDEVKSIADECIVALGDKEKDYDNLYYDYLSLDGKYKWMTDDRDNKKKMADNFTEYFNLAKKHGSIELRYDYTHNGVAPYSFYNY